MVKRYDSVLNSNAFNEPIVEAVLGDYVKFSDYEKLEAENRHLKAKLAESDKAAVLMMARFFSEEAVEKIQKENEELRRDAERYRNAVPEDVSKALLLMQAESYCAGEQSALGNELDVSVEYNKAMALIGSLIEMGRERIEAAFYAGTSWQVESNDMSCETSWKAAEAYAEKIIGGKK